MSRKIVSRFIILGAGRPFSGEQHPALRFANASSRVLDWALRAVSFIDVEPHFVCGYQAELIRAHYPDFYFHFNEQWESSRSATSLLLALPETDTECLVSYSDILFRQTVAEELMRHTADVVIAMDSQWLTRYAGRSQQDLQRCEKVCFTTSLVTRLGEGISVELAGAEFIGLVRLSSRAVAHLRTFQAQQSDKLNYFRLTNLSDLIELLRIQGLEITAVDVCGDWAQLNEDADLARFVLGTKAQTLSRLNGMLRHARIPEQVCFTVKSWRADSEYWLKAVDGLNSRSVVVRSSALSEDGFEQSNAGVYTSLLNVNPAKQAALSNAIEIVIASYPSENPENEVLVQPMLQKVVASGVVFTRTIAHGAPYYVINYDDVTGSTETITSGSSKEHKTLIIRRDASGVSPVIPKKLAALLPTLREIESLLSYDSLDVEFAVTGEGDLHVLQVRPIAVDHSRWGDSDRHFYELLNDAERHFTAQQQSSPFIQGKRTIFGIMPDWNPAEIIGTKPGQLAISLYRKLLMDDVWATQRAEYGYRDVRPHCLLHMFAGHPYVDVRASLNSFIPAQLPDELAGKIVEFCINWLEDHPHLHDKLEFEVIPTCFSLGFSHWEERFTELGGLSRSEIDLWRDALLDITLSGLERNVKSLQNIKKLEQRFILLKESDLPLLPKALAMLEDARRYGTLSFAHMARSGFVAVSLLKSAVAIEVLTQEEMDDFLNSICTVSHDYMLDAKSCAVGELSWDSFVHRYGHLRPGTYDIMSPSYMHDPERYLRPTVHRALDGVAISARPNVGSLWLKARERFVKALNVEGISGSVENIEEFLRQSIEGREYAKFSFTRNLSAALDALRDWGTELGIDTELLAQFDIDSLRALHSGQITAIDVPKWLKQRSAEMSALRRVINALELPPLLCSSEDFIAFQYPATQANFIGNTAVTARCKNLEAANVSHELTGCIVMIPQADPGYDWLFGQGISGLITMYGGANSHMAIRAAEFGLPAAIGIGEVRFRKLAGASVLELDPVNRIIRKLD